MRWAENMLTRELSMLSCCGNFLPAGLLFFIILSLLRDPSRAEGSGGGTV